MFGAAAAAAAQSLTASLLFAARASDLFGRKWVFRAGLVVFTLASLAGGLAQGPGLLLGSRIVQGIGAAALAPSSLSLITASHPEGPARNKAISLWAAVASSAGAMGLVLGGVLTSELSWRYVFFVNVPIGVALFIAAAISLRPSPTKADWSRLDLPSRRGSAKRGAVRGPLEDAAAARGEGPCALPAGYPSVSDTAGREWRRRILGGSAGLMPF